MLFSSVLSTSLHVCEVSPERSFLTAYGILVEVVWDESWQCGCFQLRSGTLHVLIVYEPWHARAACDWYESSEHVQVGLRFSCYHFFFSLSLFLLIFRENSRTSVLRTKQRVSVKIRTNTGGWQHWEGYAWSMMAAGSMVATNTATTRNPLYHILLLLGLLPKIRRTVVLLLWFIIDY